MSNSFKKEEYLKIGDAFAERFFDIWVLFFEEKLRKIDLRTKKKDARYKSWQGLTSPNLTNSRSGYATIGDEYADCVIEQALRFLNTDLSSINIPKINFSFRQVASALLILSTTIGLSGIGSSSVIGYTFGYYNDTETSYDNTLIAGEVDFVLDASTFSPTTTAVSLAPGDITVKTITVDPQDSNPFKYRVSTENVGGDIGFCDALGVDADLEGVNTYSGDLTAMLTDATTTLSTWEFTYGMGTANFQNKICNFDTEYFGSQTRHDYPLGDGYNDTEIEENTIASWGFRINKVYYDVAPDRGKEGDNEWVEIYNQTNVPLDINGWKLCDNNSCDVLSASSTIPAQGYGFITASSTTASNVLPTFWYLPIEVVEISIPDSRIGNGLNNTADMLTLKRPDGVIVDQMNWGTPDEGWANWNENVWDPGSVDVPEGSALARIPNGFDTNQPSDFVELKPPTLDLIYPDEAGSYRWRWGSTKKIKWTATNNNGPDSDLDMSIYVVKDINHDNKISDGDIMLTIADTTENDGFYKWTVPSGFLGYIWIYLVGTGPENPMLNTGTIGGDIWDPPAEILILPEDGVELANLDLEAPVITINGNNPAVIPLGSGYSDLGATVSDNVDTNLGVNTQSYVDTSVAGEYEVIYTTADSIGNTAEAVRIVVVYDPDTSSAEEALANADLTRIVPPSLEATEGQGVDTTGATSTPEVIIVPLELTDPQADPTSIDSQESFDTAQDDSTESPATSTPEVIIVPLELTDPQADPTSNGIQESFDATQDDSAESPATSTPEVIIVPLELTDPQAGSTSNGTQDLIATSTPEVITGSATSTEPLIITETATSTPEVTDTESPIIETVVEPELPPLILDDPVIDEPVVVEPTVVLLEITDPPVDTTSNGIQEPVIIEEPLIVE